MITHFGVEDEGAGWPVPVLELTARAFHMRRHTPGARVRAAERYLDTMLVAKPHELGNAFGWGSAAARIALDELVEAGRADREGSSYRLSSAARSASGGRTARRRT